MVGSGIATDATCEDSELLPEVFAQAVQVLASRSAATGVDEPASLNFLLTDGATLACSRWGDSLYLSVRERAYACGICGSNHVGDSRMEGFRAVAIASEPITVEAWEEIPDRTFLIIAPGLTTHSGPSAREVSMPNYQHDPIIANVVQLWRATS